MVDGSGVDELFVLLVHRFVASELLLELEEIRVQPNLQHKRELEPAPGPADTQLMRMNRK